MPRALMALLALALCLAAPAAGSYHEVDTVRTAAVLSEARYALLIDAGSSGSRLRMYDIKDRTAGGVKAVYPSDEDEDDFQTKPGISAYADAPADAGPSLKGLLTAAEKYIPEGERSKTPLWLKATAGMRTLDIGTINRLFKKELVGWLKDKENCPFAFQSAEVLAGEEEGLFAYLSMNYLKGSLFKPNSERVGVLDMGGASMQLAHSPEAFILASEVPFYINGERRSAYSRSQMSFGMNEALKRAFAAVVSATGEVASYAFPCFFTGYDETVTLDGKDRHFYGTSNNEECSKLTDGLLHRDYECVLKPCPMMGVYMTPPDKGTVFHAMSGFFYTLNVLGLVGWKEEKEVKISEIGPAVEKFCAQTKDEAMAAGGSPWKYKKENCFGGHYVLNVLKAYGFTDDSKVVFMRKYKGQAADWSLGAVLEEVQAMPLVLQGLSLPAPQDKALETTVAAMSPAYYRPGGGGGLLRDAALVLCTALVAVAATCVVMRAGTKDGHEQLPPDVAAELGCGASSCSSGSSSRSA